MLSGARLQVMGAMKMRFGNTWRAISIEVNRSVMD